MIERIPKTVLVGAALLCPFVLAYLAYSRPGYFTSQTYLGGLIFLELLFAAVWKYRQVFFPVVIVAFLFAGSNLPVGTVWTAARWVFLSVGVLVGCIIMLKDRGGRLGLFHAIAFFAVIAAVVSAAVSRYPGFALLKALSLLLLFLYAATGARLAVAGRENRFFAGLLTGCEIFIAAIAVFDIFMGLDSMGNPNSLGAVTGVVGAPLLLWGTLVAERTYVRRRRLALFAVCMYLVYHSHARAAMAASAISCGLLCLALRKYKMFAQGSAVILVAVAVAAIFTPAVYSDTVSMLTSTVVYKGDAGLNVLASRESPWQGAINSIRAHFWFGTGFGTTDNGQDASENLGKFSSSADATSENGSSYLAITTWVGMLGVIPFLFLVVMLAGNVLRTFAWMRRTGSPLHPAVPLALVMVAGMLHAGLEDWMFAPGYYLCVFFWCMAFVFVDVVPASPLPQLASLWRPRPMRASLGNVVASR